jgi:hypothetical protein
VPVVRTRAAGISQASTIAEKVQVWARAIEAKAGPLLDCLEALQTHLPETIAADVLNRQGEPDETGTGRGLRQPNVAGEFRAYAPAPNVIDAAPRRIVIDGSPALHEKVAAPESSA